MYGIATPYIVYIYSVNHVLTLLWHWCCGSNI